MIDGGFGLVYTDRYRIYYVALDATGASAETPMEIWHAANGVNDVALVPRGSILGVAWLDANGDPRDLPATLMFGELMLSGGWVAPAEPLVDTVVASGWTEQEWNALVWTGSAYALAWLDARHGSDWSIELGILTCP